MDPWPILTLKGWLMLCHILGALVFIGIVVLERVRLRRLSASAKAATDEGLLLLFDKLWSRIKPVRKPRLLISAANHSPMTFGAWRPVVLLPQALVATLPPEELQVILGHELAHQRRWDLWLNWLQVPLSAIWWFNPVYRLLSRKIRGVREDCCDDLVVASGLATGEAYCETLLQAARVASGCALNGVALAYIDESHPLRRRFQRIMNRKRITAPRIAWIGIILLILLALLFLPGIRRRIATQDGASATAEAQKGELPASDRAGQSLPGATGVQNIPGMTLPDGVRAAVIQVRVIERATERHVPNAALLLAAAQAVKDMDLAVAPHTDSDGRCTIPAPGASTWLTVRAEGFVPRHLRLPSPETNPHEYICKLDKGSSIGGYVRDEQGKPLENVKLSIYSTNAMFDVKQRPQELEGSDNWVYAQTDGSGRWTATELVPDPERIQLALDHPERASIKFDTVPITGLPLIGSSPLEHTSMSDLKEGKAVLVMKSGLLVSGKVTDEAGHGIEGCEVLQYESNSSPMSDWMLQPAKTDSEGQFALRVAKPGEVMLYVQAKGFAAEERAVNVVPRLPPVEFRLKKGKIVSGRVIDEGGNPIPNAAVRTGTPLVGGRIQPFSWSGKTDDGGRFLWDSAPAKPLSYGVSAAGFDPSTSLVLAPDKEHEIRLTRGSELIITGKVTDAKTKMPIDDFKVSLSMMQNAMRQINGKGGEFTLTLPVRTTPASIGGREVQPPTYGILVEAEGYLPDLSRSVEAKAGSHHVEISLVRGEGLSGVVLLPNGSPAPDAGVFLCGGDTTTAGPTGPISMGTPSMYDNVKSVRCTSGSGGSPFSAAAVTDASGRFSLKAVPKAHSLYAVHERGFAAIVPENLPDSGRITLQSWGRITGTLTIGRNPGANQPLALSTLGMAQRPPELRVILHTEPDSEGRFDFASVPPGEYRIRSTAAGGGGQSGDAIVRSGDIASIKIGGTGRPLTGRIVVAGSDPSVSSKIGSASLALKLPDDNIPSPSDAAAYRQWMESEAALARSRAQRSYGLRLEADGTFRLEDIPAGTYTLTVIVGPTMRMSTAGTPAQRPERLTHDIVVPEMPGGRSDETLDLGTITLQMPAKK